MHYEIINCIFIVLFHQVVSNSSEIFCMVLTWGCHAGGHASANHHGSGMDATFLFLHVSHATRWCFLVDKLETAALMIGSLWYCSTV